jgi:hypothetical protein
MEISSILFSAVIWFIESLSNFQSLINKISFNIPIESITSGAYFLLIMPVLTYLNADTDKTLIFKENKGKCGIYR